MRSRRIPLRLEELEPREMLDASAFADTTSKIGIFNDQLDGNLSNQLIQFIATHTDGTQKEVASYNQQFVNYNPKWALLYYKLATDAGPAAYIINNQWTSDWSTVNANESWFMHNASGQRLTNSASDWDQIDPTNTVWQQYWLNQVSANIQASGAQGVFADSFDAGIGSFWYDEYDVRFAGTNAANPAYWPNGVTWVQQLQNLANTMQQGLNNVPGAPLYIPNVDAMVTGWDNMDYAKLPAAFAEGFGDWGPSYLSGSPSDWVLSMDRALSLTDQNKVFIMQSYLQNDPNSALGLTQRGFDLGTYLLLKSQHTFLNTVVAGPQGAGYYYPEYTINLGSALAPPATDVSQYLWNNVYRRDFQNGIVLVNPSDTTYTVTLPQAYALVNFQGGGQLSNPNTFDAAGNYIAGDLSTAPVTTVTLASGQAAILMNPSLLPAASTGLSATPSSTSQINLSWNPVSGATAYWVERSTDDTNWQVLETVNGSTTTYSDTGLAAGTTYYYRVVAGNSYGNGSYSNVASATTSNPNQLNDPGFQTPNVGTGLSAYVYNPTSAPWTYSSHSGVAGNGSAFTAGNPNAPQGPQVAFIQQTGTISQAVNFTAGSYTISFDAAQRGNSQASYQTIAVEVDGTVVSTVKPSSTSYALYTTNAFTVTAGTHTVAFVGLDPNGGDNTAFLDSASIATATPPNTLSDPGFETPSVGAGSNAYKYNPSGALWTYSASSGMAGNGSAFTSGNPNAPQGTQVAFIQQTGTISQAVNFSAGTYTLSFDAAQRANNQASSQTFAVEVDGTVVGTIKPTSTSYSLYTTTAFTVTAGTHTVEFLGLNPNGGDNTAFLDNVSIAAASPPNTLVDPGFETPNVGTGSSAYKYNPTSAPWTYSASSGVAGNGSAFTAGNPNAPQGAQVAFIQQTGTISQAVNFSAGTYTISFEAAQRGSNQASYQTIAVEVDGTVVGTVKPSSTSYALYTTNTFTVTAGTHTVAFVGLDPNGGDNTAFLDNASVA